MDFWQQLENCSGEKFPPCLIKLLKECGYNSYSTITDFTEMDINNMEQFINENLKYVVADFKCCNAISYQKQTKFKFLPGHRNFILNLKCRLSSEEIISSILSKSKDQNTNKHFVPLLQTLIRTAEQNVNKISTQFRYDEIIRYFDMYIHMVCGKMCYETLSSNLPLPTSSTVRK